MTILMTFWIILSFSQNEKEVDTVANAFKTFTALPREVAYAHLNKSVYIKGETLAFTVYVFEKSTKKLSKLTTNMYCSISDESGKTIKSKLLLSDSGIIQGSFFVDSLFTSGNYTFKAYTNWMKNFDEQNFFIENIKVIDPEIEDTIVPKRISSKLDIQFLPEGGHLLSNTANMIGVVAKDTLGFGVPFVEGQILNSKNGTINTFKTNQFGIGKFMINPKDNELYHVIVNFKGTQQTFKINVADSYGISLSLGNVNNKVILRLATNKGTLKAIQNKHYQLTIHNGSEIKSTDIVFNDKLEILRLINNADLSPGINIFTLFDENNRPLLERLYFKYEGIQFLKTGQITFEKGQDSAEVFIPFKGIDTSYMNKFSISVLPEDTKAYNHHHNIISYLYLQPYVKGYIENAQYYFKDITRKKKYELDNLLLTQGWSSYDWNNIFKNVSKANYNFETGINFKAHVNETKTGKFILYPISNNGFEIFNLNEDTKTFEKDRLFPFDDETLKLSEVRKNNSAKKSEIYVQFFPSKIPDLEKYIKTLPLKESVFFDSDSSQPLLETSWTGFEQLDEVVIKVDKEKERIEKLKNSSWGTVDVFDDKKRNSYIDFADYIRTKGFMVTENNGEISILNRRTASMYSPAIYIDDRLLFDFSELYLYRMDYIDYIIIDKSGLGEGMRGAGGVIKIYTDPLISKNTSSKSIYQEIKIPLTFTTAKNFYAPKYSSYTSKFYNEYGVIEWLPAMSVDKNGNISFKIQNQQGNNIKLFIEGTANDGGLISEVKTVTLN